jgi:MFS family permease
MPDGDAAANAGASTPVPRSTARPLLALIGGQIALHSCMAGIRMAAPLAALREGHAAWAVGVLLGLFAAAPIVLALAAGRLADRHGYHVPIRVAVALSVAGGLCAVAATAVPAGQFVVLCLAAVLAGAGANFGLIAIQRSAGRMAHDPTELKRIFSWLGLAPALANVVGPVLAGTLIDGAGFQAAFAALAALPLASLVWARFVPVEPRADVAASLRRPNSWNLLREPGFTRLLLVNWLLSSSWDVHSFLVPILGHERGFSASAIGLILGVFAISVAAVRLAIPVLAHRLRESHVLVGAMLICAAVFAVYPLAHTSWVMGCCAVVLGLALGAVQPMIMTTLHQITPAARHGEAIALRSMAINFSSAVMPLAFGLAGATLGASALFWVMGAAVASGTLAARHVGVAKPALR